MLNMQVGLPPISQPSSPKVFRSHHPPRYNVIPMPSDPDWYPPPELSSVRKRFTESWDFMRALAEVKKKIANDDSVQSQ
jgi:hypothetical protein